MLSNFMICYLKLIKNYIDNYMILIYIFISFFILYLFGNLELNEYYNYR